MADEIENIRPKGLLILFTSFKLLNILDDAAFRHVITAMAAYVENGTEPEGLEPIEQVAFESQRKALDDNIEIYRKSTIAHREAGKKGGRPKKTEGNPEKPIGFSENQMEPNGFSEKPEETNSPQILKIKDYSDTNVSDISTTTATERRSKDEDLAKIVQRYQQAIGDFPRSALDKLQGWREVFSTEMILLAIDRAAEANKRSWAYINGILKGWQSDGVHTPGEAAESAENRRKAAGRSGNTRKPTESTRDQLSRVLGNMDKERGFET